jgi:hypothetical protein
MYGECTAHESIPAARKLGPTRPCASSPTSGASPARRRGPSPAPAPLRPPGSRAQQRARDPRGPGGDPRLWREPRRSRSRPRCALASRMTPAPRPAGARPPRFLKSSRWPATSPPSACASPASATSKPAPSPGPTSKRRAPCASSTPSHLVARVLAERVRFRSGLQRSSWIRDCLVWCP